MKKLLLATITIFSLGACASVDSSVVDAQKEQRFSKDDDYLLVTTDKETGCKYLVFSNWHNGSGGITPLLKADGTSDCEKR